ncbi:MAG: hypothetical protein HY903_18665 [Deltaproteobacteria bacterium]|nr:hypothetical protein [Deltaproteobacteria bacterium]
MSARRSTVAKNKAKSRRPAAKHRSKAKAPSKRAAAPEPAAVSAPEDLESEENVDGIVQDDDPATRHDPLLDRRIIEGMLHDRRVLLDDMAKQGIKAAVVMRRAADLGLSEAYIRQVQGVAADLAGERPGHKRTPTTLGARTCLSCDRVFLSAGPGNRLCMRCRGGDAGLAQL